MFGNTIDNKLKITDKNGNELVDLTTSIFSSTATGLDAILTVRMTDYFLMRPDKVSMNEYGTDVNAEFILKYSGISNPFSLDKDDILIIPEESLARAQLKMNEIKEDKSSNQAAIFYKYTNPDFKGNQTDTYDTLKNKEIPSGVLTPEDSNGFIVPYISDDGTTAITIRNGRMYFGEDSGLSPVSTTLYKEELQTLLDLKCAINGMSLTDFVRASVKNNE